MPDSGPPLPAPSAVPVTGPPAPASVSSPVRPEVVLADVIVLVFSYPASVNVRVELPWDGATLMGHGHAQLLPGDPDVPDIGRRIAVSRALHDLAERLAFIAGADMAGERERRRTGGHPSPPHTAPGAPAPAARSASPRAPETSTPSTGRAG